MEDDGFHDLVADGVYRVQGCHRLLKDHGNLVPADRAHLGALGIERGQVYDVLVPMVQDLAGFNLTGRHLNKPHNRQGGNRFAATTLANHPEGPLRFDGEINPVNSTYDPLLGVEVHLEAPYLKQRHGPVPSSPNPGKRVATWRII